MLLYVSRLKNAAFLKNAGLNTTQSWVKYGQTQQLECFDPAVWFKCLTQPLVVTPIAGLVHILPIAEFRVSQLIKIKIYRLIIQQVGS